MSTYIDSLMWGNAGTQDVFHLGEPFSEKERPFLNEKEGWGARSSTEGEVPLGESSWSPPCFLPPGPHSSGPGAEPPLPSPWPHPTCPGAWLPRVPCHLGHYTATASTPSGPSPHGLPGFHTSALTAQSPSPGLYWSLYFISSYFLI